MSMATDNISWTLPQCVEMIPGYYVEHYALLMMSM